MRLEQDFENFRRRIVGQDQEFASPYGKQKMVYADWIASGRLYGPIEETISSVIGPFIGNTHTETSENGRRMTLAYHEAHRRIKEHVHAGPADVIITTGFGMTGAIVKFQRILGLKTCGDVDGHPCLKEADRPVVFITHMEHHSNHTSWYETAADVVIVEPDKNLLFSPENLRKTLEHYKDRKIKIGSFTACSNVTGIRTPYREIARIMHENGGLAFIDFAASAPYDEIDMHPPDPIEKLDAIFFSPHKFLGGPGSSGVLIFDASLYNRRAPDQPGGGTVDWTNAWGEYKFIDNIEVREDGGTPGFLQAIRTALAIELKQQMGVARMHARENELLDITFNRLKTIQGLHILADNVTDRLGIVSFYADGIHYNLFVRLLSDRFGIQVRGGCACAGTYGHYLLNVSYEKSRTITDRINHGDFSEKPGWVRLSLHPTMTDAELGFILDAIAAVVANHHQWKDDYMYNKHTNEFRHIRESSSEGLVDSWFHLP
ncbi:MAG TPA: aminotransferase class V-fold PLP-dependent enzyme [Bacteroidales bacterium]|nr:aminotransferase class V-fold PLP-dependent enzyme [Bacteroidales bacterium]HPS61965.1 aminotransferase class V-fold PLP-dependent enzyme [Bacteroidales bacterium]